MEIKNSVNAVETSKSSGTAAVLNISLAVAISASVIQTLMILYWKSSYHWFGWLPGFTFYHPEGNAFSLLFIGFFGLVFLASYAIFLILLYEALKQRIKTGPFLCAVLVGLIMMGYVPALHLIESPTFLHVFVVIVSVGFGALIAHRVLFMLSMKKVLPTVAQKAFRVSIAYPIVCLIVLLVFASILQMPYSIWAFDPAPWYFAIAYNIYYLFPAIDSAGSLSFQMRTLPNLLLLVDLIMFNAILLFTFWNAPKRLADNSLSEK